jgi:predicted transcriptional regulator
VGRSDSRRIATMADINTAAIKEALEDAIVRAKEMDPKELAKTVAKLRADLASRPSDQDAAELAWWRSFASKFAPDELPEVGSSFTGLGPLYLAGAPLEPVELIPSSLIVARDELVGHLAGVVSAVDGMSKIIDARPSVDVATPVRKRETTNVREIRPNAGVVDIPAIGVRVERLTPDDSGSGLPSGERRLLVAIAQQRGGGATLSLLRLLSGFKTSSVKTYLTRLRGKGLVTNEGDRFHLTAGAYEILGDFEPLPTGRALRDHWLSELPDGESKILSILFGVYPHVMSVDEIVQRTPYTLSSVKTYVTRLKTKGLIVVEGGAPRASAILFEGNGR